MIICTANNIHVPPLAGTLVQVAVVQLVTVGQLPQFDARMLYSTAGSINAW